MHCKEGPGWRSAKGKKKQMNAGWALSKLGRMLGQGAETRGRRSRAKQDQLGTAYLR